MKLFFFVLWLLVFPVIIMFPTFRFIKEYCEDYSDYQNTEMLDYLLTIAVIVEFVLYLFIAFYIKPY